MKQEKQKPFYKEIKKYLKKNEVAWETYCKGTQLLYIVITKNIMRDRYFLLDVSDGTRKEIASTVNPLKLRDKMKLYYS